MGELIAPTPALLDTATRQRIADQIRFIRAYERADKWNADSRIGQMYKNELHGLTHFFDYVRSLHGSNTVLDIGTGTGRGISDLARENRKKGLTFLATGLTRSAWTKCFLSKDQFRITSGEVLRGIPNESIAGVLALYSIAYSEAPVAAIQRIDQVLVPGGAIKAAFRYRTDETEFATTTKFKSHEPFVEVLRALNYTVKSYIVPDDTNILVAIKPGGPGKITAAELLETDRRQHAEENDRRISLIEAAQLGTLSSVAVPANFFTVYKSPVIDTDEPDPAEHHWFRRKHKEKKQ